jgi:sterol desaturase/sphingolipid hydroxylase (fatty acid hydroxylase superfamily)
VTLLRCFARYGYVPIMLLGVNGMGLFLIANGHSYFTVAPLLVFAVAFSFAMEKVLPYVGSWNDSHGDQVKDLVHAFVYELQNTNCTLMLPVISWLVPWHGVWPRDWPVAAQFLLALISTDLSTTMVHYYSHRIGWLWRLHSVHHGVERLYGFNGLVRHPLHQLLDVIVGSLPLALLGMPVDVAVLLGLAVAVQLLVQHSNIDYSLGPFEGWLSIGAVHRLHHVNWQEDGDVNFGLFTTIWDRALGTLRLPGDERPGAGDIGIQGRPLFPKTYLAQLVEPFAP